MSAPPLPLARRPFLVAATLLLLPTSAAAQGMSGGNVSEIVRISVRDGHGVEFEEGVKRHMEMAEDQGNPSPWLVWEVMTGERTGEYVVGTFGHAWSDFDVMPDDPQRAQQSFTRNVEPHLAAAEVSFWTLREDLSAAMPEGEPTPFLQVYHYMPRPDGAMTAEQGFTQVKEAALAADWPGATWMIQQLVNGGPGPHYAVVIPTESFADMEEPSPSMYEMLVEEMGEDETNAMFEAFVGAMRSEASEMFAFRRDLSYLPAGGM